VLDVVEAGRVLSPRAKAVLLRAATRTAKPFEVALAVPPEHHWVLPDTMVGGGTNARTIQMTVPGLP
jgi:hypothetical protein